MSDIDLGIPGIADVIEVGRFAAYTAYQVTDVNSGQTVLVKVVAAVDVAPPLLDRFAQEQDMLVALASHPNLVSVLGQSRTTAGLPYVVTALEQGRTVADRFETTPPMTGPEILTLGVAVAGALESVHRAGVLHGDLHGRDIILSDSGEPRLADAGLAWIAGVSAASATDPALLEPVAPELLDGHPPTPASDQYALGAMLHHLFAGEAAFVRRGDTSVGAVVTRIATEPAPDLVAKGVPGPVAEVMAKAMHKNPAERYASVQDFARAMQQAEVALGLSVSDLAVMTPPNALATRWNSGPLFETAPAAFAPPASAAPSPAPSIPAPGAPPPAAPAAPPQRSRRPLVIGVGVALVVVLVAAFLLTRGDDKKNVAVAVASSSTRATGGSSASSAAPESSGSAAPAGPPPGFHLVDVAFTQGEVGVFAPDDWTDVKKVDLVNGEPELRIAPDASQLIDGTFAHPGVQIDAFGAAANGVDPNNLEPLLDLFAHLPADQRGWFGGPPEAVCAKSSRGNYPEDLGIQNDGTFTGRFVRFDSCKGAGSLVFIVAAPASQKFIVTLAVQVVTADDEPKLAVVAGSFNVFNLS